MKTKTPLVAAILCGLTAVSSAFTLDFVGYEGQSLPPNPLTISVPGYGDVQFEALGGSTLVVNSAHQNDNLSGAPSLNFDMGEAVRVTFLGLEPIDVDFDYVGVNAGEYFLAQEDIFTPQSFILTLNGSGNGAGLYAVSWNQVPEPSTALLGVLAGGAFLLRRRR